MSINICFNIFFHESEENIFLVMLLFTLEVDMTSTSWANVELTLRAYGLLGFLIVEICQAANIPTEFYPTTGTQTQIRHMTYAWQNCRHRKLFGVSWFDNRKIVLMINRHMTNNFIGLDKRRLFVIVCYKTSFIEQASQSQSLLLNLDNESWL